MPKLKENNYWLEISKSALKENLMVFKRATASRCLLAPAVKANAYGHGLVETAKILLKSGANWLCITSVAEGVKLRQAGLLCPLLVIGPVLKNDLPLIAAFNLRMFLSDESLLPPLSRTNKKIKLHIKLDSGMNRQGFRPQQLSGLIDRLNKFKNLQVEGIATHFASSDAGLQNKKFQKQLKIFSQAAKSAEQQLGRHLIKHCANSAAALLNPATHFDLIRPGIGIYGYYPSTQIKKMAEKKYRPLQPALTVKTKIALIKQVKRGDTIGYGEDYCAKKNLTLAILPLGYFEGLPRALSGRGEVLINGQHCPIIGKICMDITLVYISRLLQAAKIGDEAVIIGRQGREQLTADDLAAKADTINYEILTNWKESTERFYL